MFNLLAQPPANQVDTTIKINYTVLFNFLIIIGIIICYIIFIVMLTKKIKTPDNNKVKKWILITLSIICILASITFTILSFTIPTINKTTFLGIALAISFISFSQLF